MKMDRTHFFPTLIATGLMVFALAGCTSDSGGPQPTSASEGYVVRSADAYVPRTGDGVDVVYFETSDACDCMAEVGDAVELAIDNNFLEEIQDGSLRFYIVLSDEADNWPLLQTFKAQTFDLMIVNYEDGLGTIQPVYEIWNLMGDNAAIEAYVRAAVDASLSGQA